MFRASLLVVAFSLVVHGQDVPETVRELKVPKYIGRWYQTHASPIVYETFEQNAVCVTADYGVYNASVLTVYNANRNVTPDGALNDIRGFAYTTDETGKLFVNLDGGSGVAPYWVLKLGPETFGEQNLYEYSIVSGPTRLFLFVLTRDVTRFRARFQTEVLDWLEQNGFDSAVNEPIETYHQPDCQYAPRPNMAEFWLEEY